MSSLISSEVARFLFNWGFLNGSKSAEVRGVTMVNCSNDLVAHFLGKRLVVCLIGL